MSSTKSVDLLRSIRDILTKSGRFDNVLKHISITALHEGKFTAEFKVRPEHLNRGGGLHGGFTATVVDNCTNFALMSTNKPFDVSVDLHVSYLQGAKLGDEVLIDATTVRVGNRLAYLQCELKHKANGSIIARGTQTIFMLESK